MAAGDRKPDVKRVASQFEVGLEGLSRRVYLEGRVTEKAAGRNPLMSEETMLRDLFDRWERVWHEGRYELIPGCVGPNYIRHDEAGDRTVTREAYAAEIAKTRQERPHTRFVVFDHTLCLIIH
jgi:hypothetical protein